MTEAVRLPTQTLARLRTTPGRGSPSRDLGCWQCDTHAVPADPLAATKLHSTFPGFTSDARRAIAFAQSLPLTAALVGMKSVSHLEANLECPEIS